LQRGKPFNYAGFRNGENLTLYATQRGVITQASGDSDLVAVTADGSSSGAAWLRVIPNHLLYQFVEPGTLELAVAVTPEFFGRGVGTLLLRQLLLAAREVHRTVVLSVRASNPARRLYERLAFVTVASITNRVGTLSYVMRADLSYP